MRRGAAWLVALATSLGLGVAHADDDVAKVEVEDLPPLPDEKTEVSQTRLAVLSATSFGEDVVVGAAKREQSLGNVASAVTVVSGDRLRRMGYRTVSEALRSVAGMYVDDDHLTDRVGVRGLQVLGDFNTRLLLLVDGATVNEPWNQFTGFGWDTPFSIDDIARIEVIRGPVSSVYGTNAFFGIINVVTRGSTESPRAWGRVTGGNFGASAAAGFAMGDVDHQLRGSVSALGRVGETLAVDELGGQDIDADGAQAVAMSLAGAYEGAFGQVRFYRRVRELPFAPYESLVGSPDNLSADTLFMTEAGYTRELTPRFTATARGYANRYRYRDRLVLADGSGTFTDIGDSTWFGGEVRGRYALVDDDKLGVTAGTEVTFIATESRSFYYGDEANAAIVPKDLNLQGLYAEVDAQPLSWFALTAGVRADRNSALDDRVSPRAALFVSDHDYGAKLLYAEGFRNPSAYEGFFDDGVDFVGNPAIGAETIRSYEGVLWGKPQPGLTLRLSGFRWAAKRLVEQEAVALPDGTERLQFQNTGGLVSTGVEVEGSYRDADGWLGFGGFAYTDVNDDTGEDAVGAPKVTGSLGASTPLLGKRFHLSSEVQIITPRLVRKGEDTDPDHRTATWVGWNAALYLPSWHGFDVTLGVRNLLGQRAEIPAPEDYDRPEQDLTIAVLPGEGRELYARVGYRY